MKLKFTFLLVISCLLGSYSLKSQADITVLDFDSFVDGQIIDNEYLADYGVSIKSVNYIDGIPNNGNDINNRQVAFNTLNNNSYDNDLEYYNTNNDYNNQSSPFHYTALNIPGYSGSTNPGNILILQENNIGCEDGVCDRADDEGSRAAGYFTFNFTNVVNILNIDFFDIEDQAGQDASYSGISFFDEKDNEVYQGHFIPTMGDGQFFRQSFQNISGVKSMIINMPGSGGLDNLAFSTTNALETTEVPEPTSIVLFATALLFLARRKRVQAVSAEQQ